MKIIGTLLITIMVLLIIPAVFSAGREVSDIDPVAVVDVATEPPMNGGRGTGVIGNGNLYSQCTTTFKRDDWGSASCYDRILRRNVPSIVTGIDGCPVINPTFEQCVLTHGSHPLNNNRDFSSALAFAQSWELKDRGEYVSWKVFQSRRTV